jgi:hypothetical protein
LKRKSHIPETQRQTPHRINLINEQIALNESGDDYSLFTLHSAKKSVGEFSCCPSHTQSCTASTIFCLDDFVTTKLNSLDQSGAFIA